MFPVIILLFSAVVPFIIVPLTLQYIPPTFFPSLPAAGHASASFFSVGFMPSTPKPVLYLLDPPEPTPAFSTLPPLPELTAGETSEPAVRCVDTSFVGLSLAIFAIFGLLGYRMARRNRRPCPSATITRKRTRRSAYPANAFYTNFTGTLLTSDDMFTAFGIPVADAKITFPVVSSLIKNTSPAVKVESPSPLHPRSSLVQSLPLASPEMKFPWIPKTPVRKHIGPRNFKPMPVLNLALLPREDDSDDELLPPQLPKPGATDVPRWEWEPEPDSPHERSTILSPTSSSAKQCSAFFPTYDGDPLSEQIDPFFVKM